MYLPTPVSVSTGLSQTNWVLTFDVEDEDGNTEEAHVVVPRHGPKDKPHRVVRRRKAPRG